MSILGISKALWYKLNIASGYPSDNYNQYLVNKCIHSINVLTIDYRLDHSCILYNIMLLVYTIENV